MRICVEEGGGRGEVEEGGRRGEAEGGGRRGGGGRCGSPGTERSEHKKGGEGEE